MPQNFTKANKKAQKNASKNNNNNTRNNNHRPNVVVKIPRAPRPRRSPNKPPTEKKRLKVIRKAQAFALAAMWLNPEKYASGGYNTSGINPLCSVINPDVYCFRAAKHTYLRYAVTLRKPASGPRYARICNVSGQIDNNLLVTTDDPPVGAGTGVNLTDVSTFVGHYCGIGSEYSFPNFPIGPMKVGTRLPVILKYSPNDDILLPSITSYTNDYALPVSFQTTSGGTATNFYASFELNRPSTSAWQIHLRGINAAGTVLFTLPMDMAAGAQSGAGSVSVTAISSSSLGILIEAIVTTAPSSDVIVTKLQWTKTTTTTAGTHTMGFLSPILPVEFESENYLITWTHIYDSPSLINILKNNWSRYPAVKEAESIVLTDLTPKMYEGGRIQKGLVEQPMYFMAPSSALTNNSFNSEIKLENGGGHCYIPGPGFGSYGTVQATPLRQNVLMVLICPEAVNDYQNFSVTMNEVYSLCTMDSGVGGIVNLPDSEVYNLAIRMVGAAGLKVTHNADHLAAFRELIRRGKRFYHKHQGLIDTGASVVGGTLTALLALA